MFDWFLSQEERGTDWYFLALPAKQDPSEELLAELRRVRSTVEPVSEMVFDDWPRHKDTGGQGILLAIEAINWIDASTVVVDAAHISGSESAGGWRLTLRLVDGEWKVAERTPTWES